MPRHFKRVVILSFLMFFAVVSSSSNSMAEKTKDNVHKTKSKGELFSALIRVESSNRPRAYQRRTGARGLTQIRRIAWRDLKRRYPAKYKHLKYKKDIFRPKIARQAGMDYLEVLRYYLEKEKIPVTLDNLLAAYNWGIRNLSRLGLRRAPLETRNYIRKIRILLQDS